jgi:hypothetical protein
LDRNWSCRCHWVLKDVLICERLGSRERWGGKYCSHHSRNIVTRVRRAWGIDICFCSTTTIPQLTLFVQSVELIIGAGTPIRQMAIGLSGAIPAIRDWSWQLAEVDMRSRYILPLTFPRLLHHTVNIGCVSTFRFVEQPLTKSENEN